MRFDAFLDAQAEEGVGEPSPDLTPRPTALGTVPQAESERVIPPLEHVAVQQSPSRDLSDFGLPPPPPLVGKCAAFPEPSRRFRIGLPPLPPFVEELVSPTLQARARRVGGGPVLDPSRTLLGALSEPSTGVQLVGGGPSQDVGSALRLARLGAAAGGSHRPILE